MKQHQVTALTLSPVVPLMLPLDLQPLFDFTQEHQGTMDGIPEQLCVLVTTITHGHAVLELTVIPFITLLPHQHVSILVSYQGYSYGSLHLLPDPHRSNSPTIPLAQGRLLASCVAQQCYLLEQSALLAHFYSTLPVALIDPLTDRESALLSQLFRGNSVATIAQQWSVTVRTIEKHRENLFQRLGVDNCMEALLAAYHFQLLPFQAPRPEPLAPPQKRSYRKRRH